MTEETGKRVTVRVPEELHKPARTKVAELDSTFQSILLDLLRSWVKGERQVEPPRKAAQVERHHEETELLHFVLDRGTKNDAEWIRGNLRNFAEAIRSRDELGAQERRIVEEFRRSSFEKQRKILAAAGKMEDPLGPEAMPSEKSHTGSPRMRRAGGKSG